jgi:hypothetical protein
MRIASPKRIVNILKHYLRPIFKAAKEIERLLCISNTIIDDEPKVICEDNEEEEQNSGTVDEKNTDLKQNSFRFFGFGIKI